MKQKRSLIVAAIK